MSKRPGRVIDKIVSRKEKFDESGNLVGFETTEKDQFGEEHTYFESIEDIERKVAEIELNNPYLEVPGLQPPASQQNVPPVLRHLKPEQSPAVDRSKKPQSGGVEVGAEPPPVNRATKLPINEREDLGRVGERGDEPHNLFTVKRETSSQKTPQNQGVDQENDWVTPAQAKQLAAEAKRARDAGGGGRK